MVTTLEKSLTSPIVTDAELIQYSHGNSGGTANYPTSMTDAFRFYRSTFASMRVAPWISPESTKNRLESSTGNVFDPASIDWAKSYYFEHTHGLKFAINQAIDPPSIEWLKSEYHGQKHSAHKWSDALERIIDLARLEDDWDTYGSVPISSLAVDTARTLISLFTLKYRVPLPRILPFHISPIPGGGIQIEWRFERSELEVNVGSDGTLSYLLIQNEGDEESYQEVDDIDSAQIIELVANISFPS